MFPALAATAVWTLFFHIIQSGTPALFEKVCDSATVNGFTEGYTTFIPALDVNLCMFISFFEEALKPSTLGFLKTIFGGWPVIQLILVLEGSRHDSPSFAIPVVIGLVYQVITAGLVFPLWWLAFILYTNDKPAAGKKPVSQLQAEGALLGLLIGYCSPTWLMVESKHPLVILYWQFFPLLIHIVQTRWIALRPASLAAKSGHIIVQISLFLTLSLSTYTYAIGLQSAAQYPLKELETWLPSWSIPDPKTTTLSSAVLHFLQYDAAITLVATAIAGIILLKSQDYKLVAIFAAPILILVLGPAAYVALLWMVREWELNQKVPTVDLTKLKLSKKRKNQ